MKNVRVNLNSFKSSNHESLGILKRGIPKRKILDGHNPGVLRKIAKGISDGNHEGSPKETQNHGRKLRKHSHVIHEVISAEISEEVFKIK